MYKLPIKSPSKPIITQVFGNSSNNDWYRANGIFTDHNGVDFITGNAIQTYGTPLVCPFPEAKVIKIVWDSPMTTKGNGITIKSGNLQIVLWHTGEIKVKLNQKLKEGDVVCYIGNSGLCRPAPTTARPYDGSHLHFMLFVDNVLTDPLTKFDASQWYLGEDSGLAHDMEPAKWSWSTRGVTDWWIKMLEAIRWWN